ncbi:MAG: hypothetical protein DHS20C06_02600 [Hyphobacterium sp.]|nr:MAG: hypothetical protein DHS20C06_02600 [Hyphobacterium sp.]
MTPKFPRLVTDLLVSAAIWTLLICLASGFVWIDQSRIGQTHDILMVFASFAFGFIPWLVLLPVVFRSAETESYRQTGILGSARHAAFIATACFGALMAYLLFVFAPLTGQTTSEALSNQQFTQWLWDVSFFSLSYLTGRVYGLQSLARRTLPGRIAVKSPDRMEFIAIDDLIAVTGQGNYAALISENREVLHRAKISEMEDRLLPFGFCRIHRSHLVRPSAVISVKLQGQRVKSVMLPSGCQLPVSDSYSDQLEARLSDGLLKG